MTNKLRPDDHTDATGTDDQTSCRPLAGPDATLFGPGIFGDTSPSSARRYFAGLASLSPERRLELVAGLSRTVRSLAMAGARQRHPELKDAGLRLRVAEVMYGRIEQRFGLERQVGNASVNEDDFQPIDLALRVGEALESLGIAYFVVGALASGMHGEPRATNDLDLVVELNESQVAPLVLRLGPDFSVDEEGLRAAVRADRFDPIYFRPFFTKVDLVVCRSAPFDRSELARRRRLEVRPGRFLWIESAEDTVLRKLLWFRQGGETSEGQWRDLTSVLRISGGSLDSAYIDQWAPVLGVEELLARARAEVGQG